jgi:hypothetical protein
MTWIARLLRSLAAAVEQSETLRTVFMVATGVAIMAAATTAIYVAIELLW